MNSSALTFFWSTLYLITELCQSVFLSFFFSFSFFPFFFSLSFFFLSLFPFFLFLLFSRKLVHTQNYGKDSLYFVSGTVNLHIETQFMFLCVLPVLAMTLKDFTIFAMLKSTVRRMTPIKLNRFLDAPSHVYKRVCPSVRRSVRPSVRLSRVIFRRVLGAS